MTMWLKQSTAVTVKLGPFLDDTDGKTAETALTISQADVRLSKNGGDYAQKNDATACTHDELGEYDCPLNTTDTDTLGRLRLMVQESGALPVWHDYMVVPANVWDSLFGSDKLQVHADEITAGLITAVAIATDAIDADALAADALAEINAEVDTALADYDPPTKAEMDSGFAGLNDPTAAAIADAVWDEAKSGHVGAGSFGEEVQAHSLSSEISALNDLSAAEVNAEVDTALADIHLDHILAVDTGASLPGAAGSVLHDLLEDDGGTWRYSANALEQAPTGGTNPNVLVSTTIASVSSQTEFTLTAGSNDDDAYNDQAIVLYDASDSDYPSVRTVSSYVGSTKTATIDSAPDFTIVNGDGVKIFVTAPGTTAPTAAEVADAVWDEDIVAAHNTADTAGALLDDVGAEVWANSTRTLTQAAASVIAVVSGSDITIQRGDTLSASLTGLGSLSGYASLDFSVKESLDDSDNDAIIRIRKNESGSDDGLLRLNKAAAADTSKGSIIIDDESAGDITITLDASVADDLAIESFLDYDVQMITASAVSTLTNGKVDISGDVTRAVS